MYDKINITVKTLEERVADLEKKVEELEQDNKDKTLIMRDQMILLDRYFKDSVLFQEYK